MATQLSLHGERLFELVESSAFCSGYLPLSGWDPPAGVPPFALTQIELPSDPQRYLYQNQTTNNFMDQLLEVAASWVTARSSRLVNESELLITPGATAAITVLLHYYVSLGYDLIVADTPLYFSYYRVSSSLRLQLHTTDRTALETLQVDPLLTLIKKFQHKRKIIVITDPRYSVSTSLTNVDLDQIISAMGANDRIIIDRAMDLRSALPFSLHDQRIIEIWSVGKPVCINSCRTAIISAQSREIVGGLAKTAGWIYGALDGAALSLTRYLLGNFPRYKERARAVVELTKTRFNEHSRIFADTKAFWPPPDNGYLSLLTLDSEQIGRYQLYRWLIKNHVHAMFAPNMGLLQDFRSVSIRVNHLLDISVTLARLEQFVRSKG